MRDRALVLEFRFKDGTSLAFSYALLDRAEYDPALGITLHFAAHTLRLVGRRLNDPASRSLCHFDLVLRHRATWVSEHARGLGGREIERIEVG